MIIKKLLLVALISLMISCTISLQNISTHGIAEDLVDQNQKADANIETQLTVPAI